MLTPNVPTDEGRAVGRELSKLYDAEAASQPDERCPGCAFRAGTQANGCLNTVRDALKAALQKRPPFRCHETGRVCAGWRLVTSGARLAVVAPWPWSALANKAERQRLGVIPPADAQRLARKSG